MLVKFGLYEWRKENKNTQLKKTARPPDNSAAAGNAHETAPPPAASPPPRGRPEGEGHCSSTAADGTAGGNGAAPAIGPRPMSSSRIPGTRDAFFADYETPAIFKAE